MKISLNRQHLICIGSAILVCSVFSGCHSLKGSNLERATQLSQAIQNSYRVSSQNANRIAPIIVENSQKYDVSPTLIAAVIQQESSYRSKVTSPAGAVGLMQVTPKYWQKICGNNLFDEQQNINCGTYILTKYYEQSGSWKKALGYYNVGPSGYENSFWTRQKAKSYVQSVKKHERLLQKEL